MTFYNYSVSNKLTLVITPIGDKSSTNKIFALNAIDVIKKKSNFLSAY